MGKFNYWMWSYKNPRKAEWLERSIVLIFSIVAIYAITYAVH